MADSRRNNGWTLGIVSVALFMAVLDNLVVSVAAGVFVVLVLPFQTRSATGMALAPAADDAREPDGALGVLPGEAA